ncbi:hypothetical protein KUCAC02_025023 [Chaenocephalus aceratus]|nr:hypothetical protein KUCAC02_025023 [Chaenocephalus aceratus]
MWSWRGSETNVWTQMSRRETVIYRDESRVLRNVSEAVMEHRGEVLDGFKRGYGARKMEDTSEGGISTPAIISGSNGGGGDVNKERERCF